MYKKILLGFSNPSLLVMFFLGISCGLPLALTASTLKTWLSASMEISFKEIAAFAFIAIPYSIKFLWSPFVDSIQIPVLKPLLGHRRSWLLFSQLLLMCAIIFLGFAIYNKNLLWSVIAAICVAFCSATQDIVTDAYRIESLPPELQAMGVTMYIYGYRIGLYISGAGLLVVAHTLGWSTTYYVASFLILIGVLTTLFCKNSDHLKNYEPKHSSYREYFTNTIVKPFEDFAQIKNWYYIIAFVILFKLGDAVAGNLTQPFLLKLGFSLKEIALYNKTYTLIGVMIGAFLGSIIYNRLSPISSLLFAGVLQMLSNLMFVYQNHIGHNVYALIATVLTENICGSLGDVIFIGYLSSLCSFKFAATQYALLSSIATIGRSMLSGTSGFIADQYGWDAFFIVSALAALPGLFMILKIKNLRRLHQ